MAESDDKKKRLESLKDTVKILEVLKEFQGTQVGALQFSNVDKLSKKVVQVKELKQRDEKTASRKNNLGAKPSL